MSQGTDFAGGRTVPGFAKIIMLFQMLVIVFLSSWIYEEYLNNIYLQSYVNDVIQADGSLIAILVIVSTLGLAVGLLRILKSTHRQIGAIVNQTQAPALSPTMSTPKQATVTDLHPMVAALKAELGHQVSMEPLPTVERKEVQMPPQVPSQPNSPPARTLTGTPSTVITGTMPVLKRVNPDQDRNQNSSQ